MPGYNMEKASIEQEVEERVRVMDDDSLLDEFERVARTHYFDRTVKEDIAYDIMRSLLLTRMAKPTAG